MAIFSNKTEARKKKKAPSTAPTMRTSADDGLHEKWAAMSPAQRRARKRKMERHGKDHDPHDHSKPGSVRMKLPKRRGPRRKPTKDYPEHYHIKGHENPDHDPNYGKKGKSPARERLDRFKKRRRGKGKPSTMYKKLKKRLKKRIKSLRKGRRRKTAMVKLPVPKPTKRELARRKQLEMKKRKEFGVGPKESMTQYSDKKNWSYDKS